MKVVIQEHTVFFDVDDTLILTSGSDALESTIQVKDPLDKEHYIAVKKHSAMIRLLKEEAQRGSYVVVWSRGGWEWAQNVVQALDIEQYVDQVMTKPLAYFDDKDIKEWLTYRVYIPPGVRYKE